MDLGEALRVLELPRFASEEEVRAAYKRLAVSSHPDKGGTAEAFDAVRKAYDALTQGWARAEMAAAAGGRTRQARSAAAGGRGARGRGAAGAPTSLARAMAARRQAQRQGAAAAAGGAPRAAAAEAGGRATSTAARQQRRRAAQQQQQQEQPDARKRPNAPVAAEPVHAEQPASAEPKDEWGAANAPPAQQQQQQRRQGGRAGGADAQPEEQQEGEQERSMDVPESDLLAAGHAAYARGDLQSALAYYDGAEHALVARSEAGAAGAEAVELGTRLGEAMEARCRTHLRLGNALAALPDAAAAAALRPMWMAAFVTKGEAMLALQMWAGAVAALQRAAELAEIVDGGGGSAAGNGADGPGGHAFRRSDVGRLLDEARAVLHSKACVGVAHAGSAVTCIELLKPHPLAHLLKKKKKKKKEKTDADDAPAGDDKPDIRVAVGCESGLAFVFAVPSGECVATLEGHEAAVTALAWCPDGSGLLATASADGTARLWTMSDEGCDAECAAVLRGHEAPLRCVSFDAFGAVLATAGDDRRPILWDSHTGLMRMAMAPLHKKRINKCVFSPSGRQLTTASDDEDCRVWDLMGDIEGPGECLHTLRWTAGRINELCYTPCGRMIVFATHCAEAARVRQNRLLVFSAVSGRILRYYDSHLCAMTALSFRPGRDEENEYDIMLTSSLDGTIVEWEIKGEPVGEGKPETVIDKFKGLPLSGDALKAVQVTLRGMGETLHAGDGCFTGAFHGVAYAPDGKRFAAISQDGTLRILTSIAKSTLREWQCPAPQRHLAYSSCGAALVTADDEGRVSMWDPAAEAEGLLAKEYRSQLRLLAEGASEDEVRAVIGPLLLEAASGGTDGQGGQGEVVATGSARTSATGGSEAAGVVLPSAAQARGLLEQLGSDGEEDEGEGDIDVADPEADKGKLGALKPRPNRGLGLGYSVNPLGVVVSADPKSLGLERTGEDAELYGPGGVPLAITFAENNPDEQQMHRLAPDLQEAIRYKGPEAYAQPAGQ